MTFLLRARRALVLVVALAACADDPTVKPAQAAGVYVLASVTGPGPSTGTITLNANGSADRQAHYTSLGSPPDQHFVGSFRIEGDSIAFMLSPTDKSIAGADFVWPVTGLWLGSEFTLQYAPVGGPDIVEHYRKQ